MRKTDVEGLWSHIHWLSVLEEVGSYTAAAARLGVSKSAVSQRISELEKATGQSLVQRTTRSVRLTDAGQTLVREVHGAFEHIAESFSQVRDCAGAIRGVVRLTAPVAFARQQLVPRISGFLALNPEVQVKLDVSDHLSSMSAEGYDLAVRHSYQIPDTHVAWKLCDTRSVLVATPAYLEKHGVPDSPNELLGHNCLFYPRGSDAPAWTFELPASDTGSGERVTVPITGNFATNNSEALRDAALQHLGIALLPDFSAQAAMDTGALLPVLDRWDLKGAFADEIHLVRPYSRQIPRSVTALVEYLRSCFSTVS